MAPSLARQMAAVLAYGERAVLSNQSAGALGDWVPYPARSGPVHVTVAGRRIGRRPGIVVHHVRELPPDEVTRLHRIPVTTPVRTLLGLAATVSTGELEHAVATALRRHVTTRAKLDADAVLVRIAQALVRMAA